MTARFAKRLSILDWVVLTSALVGVTLMSFPAQASASVENRTPLVFEIKSFPKITIPEIESDQDDKIAPEQETAQVEAAPIQVEPKVIAASLSTKILPPRTIGDEKVFMHEPEIREYICPKIGQKACNIFVAILKAENGTHECTRDNRGLNRNGSVDVGLAQINWNPKHSPYSFEQLQDCKFNLDIALKKYEGRGFQPWVAYNKGTYKKFLRPTSTVN